MADNTPEKRIRRIMTTIDWPAWREKRKASRVRSLQYIFADSSRSNDNKIGTITERLGFFLFEDETLYKVKNLSDRNRHAVGSAEESAVLLEISSLFMEMFFDEYPCLPLSTGGCSLRLATLTTAFNRVGRSLQQTYSEQLVLAVLVSKLKNT